MKHNVVHLITGLGKGGAETMLYQVLKYRTDPNLQYKVISLSGGHYYEEPMRALGVTVVEVPFLHRPLSGFLRICREIRGADTLCCWMYHANLVGYLAGRMMRIERIVWTIHHSNLDLAVNKKRTMSINQICSQKSRNVSTILYTGNHARTIHEAAGYCHERSVVADNGCDCEEYKPDAGAAESLRAELGIPTDKRIVLSVTKDTPIKDVPTFVRAFGALRRRDGDLSAVLCGPGVETGNERLTALCREAGLAVGEDVFLLGMRHDVPRLLAACNLYVLHSKGEAFPVALTQAMACGCVCVTTDVGDARRILDNDGCVVPPGEPDALAAKMAELLALPEDEAEEMRRANRARARERFEIREIVKQYEEWF